MKYTVACRVGCTWNGTVCQLMSTPLQEDVLTRLGVREIVAPLAKWLRVDKAPLFFFNHLPNAARHPSCS
jgi:hypothetical protein